MGKKFDDLSNKIDNIIIAFGAENEPPLLKATLKELLYIAEYSDNAPPILITAKDNYFTFSVTKKS